MTIREISPRELKALLERGTPPPILLDVREPWEAQIVSLPNSILIPLRLLSQRMKELPVDSQVAIYCHHGLRSVVAGEFLERHGYTVMTLAGGIDVWSRELDPTLPQY